MQSGNNQSSLHELAVKNDVENLTSKILSRRVSTDKRDKDYRTPLHLAAIVNKGKSHFEVIEILLKNGANPNARDELHGCDGVGNTPLWHLVGNGDVEILKLFLKFKAEFTRLQNYGFSLLIPAISLNNLDALKFLIQDIGYGVNYKDKNYIRMTSLQLAAKFNKQDSHYEILKYLLEMGSEVNALDSQGKTSLYYVFQSGNLRVFDLFLSYNVNLEVGKDILFEFVKNNSDVKVLEKLFLLSSSKDLSLDVNQRDADGRTPLFYAIEKYYNSSQPIFAKAIKCLLKNGATINTFDIDGIMPLIFANISRFIVKDRKEASYFANFLFEQADFSVVLRHLYGSNNGVDELILKHVAKLKNLKISVHPIYQKEIEDNTEFKDFFNKCTNELKIMSSTKLQNSWITFFNLLVDDRRKLKNYSGNEDLIEDYNNNDWSKMFPIYGDSLKRNFEKALRRRELFDKSSILLSDCLPILNPNHLIVKDILDCVLSKKDLSIFLSK